MPYALFSNDAKVSKSFRTKSEVWQHAERSGLIAEVGSFEEDPPRRILDMGYVIRECRQDPQDISAASGQIAAEPGTAPIIAAARVSPPSAAAAS